MGTNFKTARFKSHSPTLFPDDEPSHSSRSLSVLTKDHSFTTMVLVLADGNTDGEAIQNTIRNELWRLQGKRMIGCRSVFIFTILAVGGLSSEGEKKTKNSTTNWIIIKTNFDVLSRMGR